MKAKLLVCVSGALVRPVGTIIEGEEAARFVARGLAVPMDADEMAVKKAAPERAVRKTTK